MSVKTLNLIQNSGAPLLSKIGNLSIREISVVTSAYARTPARTDYGGGGGEFQDNLTGVQNAIFSWREIERCCQGNWRFWKKRVFFKVELVYKTIQLDRSEV